jgi:hypothetical protein
LRIIGVPIGTLRHCALQGGNVAGVNRRPQALYILIFDSLGCRATWRAQHAHNGWIESHCIKHGVLNYAASFH